MDTFLQNQYIIEFALFILFTILKNFKFIK